MKARPFVLSLALVVLLLLLLAAMAAPAGAASPPTITGVTPDFGGTPGGSRVIISGTGFTGATSVKIGGAAATNVVVQQDTVIVATTPSHADTGVADVVVTTAAGASTGGQGLFFYTPRYQQTEGNILYAGTWTSASASAASGGSYRYATSAGSNVKVAFQGLAFAWLGKRGPDQGIATVQVDGGTVFYVDLYSATPSYVTALYADGALAPSMVHVVKISYTGTKNTLSTGTAVNVDAFDIYGNLYPYSRLEQSDARMVYSGTWSTFSASGASGGSYKRTSDKNAAVNIPFFGKEIALYCTRGTTLSRIDIFMDGSPIVAATPDLSYSSVLYQRWIFTAGFTQPGDHLMTLKPDPDNMPGKFISLDCVEVLGYLLTPWTVEQNNAFFTYAGAWTALSASSYSGGSYAYTNTAGSSASFTFEGVKLDLVAKKGPTYGIAKVTLDGTKTFTVDLYSATTRYKQNVWSTGFLRPGTHTVLIEWTGTKNAAATKTNIGVDSVLITGGLP